MQLLEPSEIAAFQEVVWAHYRSAGRGMPWREEPSPYRVLVSELMLQQTQVSRVIPKFNAFLSTFENIASLASASLGEVLMLWSGLGYNRRAKYLHQTAQMVVRDFNGRLPSTRDELVKLPGIGKNTAGAILAYAYDQPVVFVETNIRTVLFHHFYPDATEPVSDKELEVLVEQTLDKDNPREWYWALMDYGTFLKQTAGARLQSSSHYKKQSPLRGSLREMRGRIVRALVAGEMAREALQKKVEADERFELALAALIDEGMIVEYAGSFGLTSRSEPA